MQPPVRVKVYGLISLSKRAYLYCVAAGAVGLVAMLLVWSFTVEPTQSGTIIVRSPSCKEMIKVNVYAAKAATAVRSPSFTG